MRFVLSAAVMAALLVPTSAGAAPNVLPPVEKTLTASKAAKRTCAAQLLSANRKGIARSTYKAPMSGYLNIRLSGARNADWDLVVFDRASGRRLGSSQAFGSTELVQSWVTSGQVLSIQACRRSGNRTVALETQLVDLRPPKRLGTPSLVNVKIGSGKDLQKLETLGLDVTHNIKTGSADVVLNTAKELSTLKSTGLGFTTRIADLAKNYDKSRAADARYAKSLAGAANLPSGNRTSYRELADYENELKKLTETYPGHVKPVKLPQKTYEGREIGGVEIAGNVNGPEDGRPVYFIVGVHHAREWPAGEIPLEFAYSLAKGYGSDARITALLDKVRVVIVPILNKDGFHASREASKSYSLRDQCNENIDYDLCTTTELETVEGVPAGGNAAYRRKNCHGIVFPKEVPCELQNGVDPNRNYGEGWGGIGATMNPYGQTYRGTGPWSEPETQAIHEYTRSRQVTNLITVHNVAALVLRPPGRKADGLAPDEPRMKELGNKMAAATGYTSQYGWQLYDTSGGTEDWNYAAAGTFGYTIEVGPESGNFHMPYQTGVVNEWEGPGTLKGKGMREALMISLESAANEQDHSVIEGSAPAGRVLRAKKKFQTLTSPVCQIALDDPGVDQCQAPGDRIAVDDFLESTMVVPENGKFEYHVTPSTRPFVAMRRDEILIETRKESYEPAEGEAPEPTGSRLIAEDEAPDASAVTRTFTVTEADKADDLVVDLTFDPVGGGEYTSPEDYDLRLYYKKADGTKQPIGIANNDVPPNGAALIWNLPEGHGGRIGPFQPEQLVVTDPPVGEYEARIVNRMATGSTWKLDVTRIDRQYKVVMSGKTESWTLTCESTDGKTVYATHQVTVNRGERLNLNACDANATPTPVGGGDGGGGSDGGGNGGGGDTGAGGDNGGSGGGNNVNPPAVNPRGDGGVKGKPKSAKAKKLKAAKKKRAACNKKAKKKFKKAKKRKAAVKRCTKAYKKAVKRAKRG